MTRPLETILLVDDQPANLSVLSELLENEGYQLFTALSGEDALALAKKVIPSLILLDIVLPHADGLDVCRQLRGTDATRDIPVIFITGRTEISARVEGFRAGAVDYIVKPFEAEEVLARVRTQMALARARRGLEDKNRELAATLERLRAEVSRRELAEDAKNASEERLSALAAREARRWNVAGLVGRSAPMTAMLQEIQKLQNYERVGVLLVGESGTGKELVARALHSGSARRSQPFIPINCVAVPTELMESTFFGHTRGAFTGAQTDRKGLFELAHGGTLFLDEIGDMPSVLQAKLLRVLEDGRVMPVGGAVEKQVDVRVIAATNADLPAKMASGAFRQDLYFRLARTMIRLPSLRERREDLALLANHFLQQFALETGTKTAFLSRGALEALKAHPFPGNVRELRNLLENAVITSTGNEITPEHLRLPLPAPAPSSTSPTPGPISGEARPDKSAELPFNLEEAERLLTRRALAQTGGNLAEAARMLGVHRSRIYRLLEGGV